MLPRVAPRFNPILLFVAASRIQAKFLLQLLCEVQDVSYIGGLLLATYYVFNTRFAAATSMTYTALETLILGKASSKIVSSVANVLASL